MLWLYQLSVHSTTENIIQLSSTIITNDIFFFNNFKFIFCNSFVCTWLWFFGVCFSVSAKSHKILTTQSISLFICPNSHMNIYCFNISWFFRTNCGYVLFVTKLILEFQFFSLEIFSLTPTYNISAWFFPHECLSLKPCESND